MRNFSLILRLVLATTIVLGLLPAQAITPACLKPVQPTCHKQTHDCCKKPDKKASCNCIKSGKPAPDLATPLTAAPQIQLFAILSEPTPQFHFNAQLQEPKIPEPKANAPPGEPPSESASRAPPVNL